MRKSPPRKRKPKPKKRSASREGWLTAWVKALPLSLLTLFVGTVIVTHPTNRALYQAFPLDDSPTFASRFIFGSLNPDADTLRRFARAAKVRNGDNGSYDDGSYYDGSYDDGFGRVEPTKPKASLRDNGGVYASNDVPVDNGGVYASPIKPKNTFEPYGGADVRYYDYSIPDKRVAPATPKRSSSLGDAYSYDVGYDYGSSTGRT
jgi:hypothetical protein